MGYLRLASFTLIGLVWLLMLPFALVIGAVSWARSVICQQTSSR